MKKHLFALFIFISWTWRVSAQAPYHKMVVEGNEWKVESNYCDYYTGCNPASGPAIIYYYTYYYKLQGDTLIDSIQYKVMYLSMSGTCDNCTPGHGPISFPFCTAFAPVALLTEDTLSRKVFYKPLHPGSSDVSSVIDFSLNTGDSTEKKYNQYNTFPDYDSSYLMIDSIGFSQFQLDTVKTWYLSNRKVPTFNHQDIRLYEGIGYSYGFFLDYNFADGTSIAGRLTGFCKNDSCWSSCRVTNLNDILPETDIQLYPNPVFNTVVIKSNSTIIDSIEFYSVDGRKMKTTNSTSTDVSDFPPGFYFAKVITATGLIYRRFIKS